MWKWLIGPALLGSACVAGSVYGRDAEQIVHKRPSDAYAAIEQALGNIPQSGTTYFDGGTPMRYEVQIDRDLDRRLVVILLFGGQRGADAELDFAPMDDGQDTLITAKIHGEHAVLKSVLAGTNRARLAYAPDWALNIAAHSLLQQLASEIEQGQTAMIVGPTSEGEAEAQWESNLSDEQRNEVQDWRQYSATLPTSDPDAAAANYMGNGE